LTHSTLFSVNAEITPPPIMSFNLSSSSKVSFRGDRHVHLFMAHKFSDPVAPLQLQLSAQARQFSSFILVVGQIESATSFSPSAALIIQNRDDLKIPLLLDTIPTPKKFRDSIESLSPEQKAFCKAYRQLQIASTLFGIIVIQIKPQLERVLNLPEDSLTKEIKLNQDLEEFFIKYSISSDLLSFDGNCATSTSAERLMRVKENAAAMRQMVNDAKETEVQLMQQQRVYNNEISPPLPPPTPASTMNTLNMPTYEHECASFPQRSVLGGSSRPFAKASIKGMAMSRMLSGDGDFGGQGFDAMMGGATAGGLQLFGSARVARGGAGGGGRSESISTLKGFSENSSSSSPSIAHVVLNVGDSAGEGTTSSDAQLHLSERYNLPSSHQCISTSAYTKP